jgi:CBS-domain-containing membrane protein
VENAPSVQCRTPLREVLPHFVEDGDAPVAVVDEGDHLVGVIVRGALIAGLTMTTESHNEERGEDFSGISTDEMIEDRDRVRVRRVGE